MVARAWLAFLERWAQRTFGGKISRLWSQEIPTVRCDFLARARRTLGEKNGFFFKKLESFSKNQKLIRGMRRQLRIKGTVARNSLGGAHTRFSRKSLVKLETKSV